METTGVAFEREATTLIGRYFQEVWNAGKLDVLDDIIDPHYINHSSSGNGKVAAYLRVTGTHTNPLFGIAPKGGKIDVRQMQIEWIRNGRIWQHWRITDEATLMKQIGV